MKRQQMFSFNICLVGFRKVNKESRLLMVLMHLNCKPGNGFGKVTFLVPLFGAFVVSRVFLSKGVFLPKNEWKLANATKLEFKKHGTQTPENMQLHCSKKNSCSLSLFCWAQPAINQVVLFCQLLKGVHNWLLL